jgi:c-di-GMP-binding flagellar brake protein YcgR
MEQSEIIKHKHRLNIFEQLEKHKTFVKMHVLGKKYERLTVVTGTYFNKNIPCFLVDCPHDFARVAADLDNCRIHFEFIGNDHLQYSFRTTVKEIVRDEILIRFPEVIHRFQRRKNFRIPTPLGTKLYVNGNRLKREMSVINVSRGGAFGTLFRVEREAHLILNVGNKLRNIELAFPIERNVIRVQIKEALVKRVGKSSETDQNTCALQFTDINKNQEKILIDLIYRFQRDFLRRRFPGQF